MKAEQYHELDDELAAVAGDTEFGVNMALANGTNVLRFDPVESQRHSTHDRAMGMIN